MFDHFAQLNKYRQLIGALIVRHLAMRYRGSLLGFLWSILTPLCLMAVYTLVFRFYMRAGGIENYAIFVFCGLLPWIWFTSALNEGTSAIVSSGHLITKSLFPPQVLPLVTVCTSMINFLLSLPVLFLFMWGSGLTVHLSALLVPGVMLLQFFFCYGLVLGLSALNVFYRDVQHILANALTFLFFLCPIVYSADMVPERFRFSLEYNPIALLTIFYQDLILKGVVPPLREVLTVSGMVVLIFSLGLLLFNRNREGFAEVL